MFKKQKKSVLSSTKQLMWYLQSSSENSLSRMFCSTTLTLIPKDSYFSFSALCWGFLKYQSDFWSGENVIKYCPFLLTSDEIRMGTGKALVAPAHKSIFTAAQKEETRGEKTKPPSISNNNFPSSPLFFQVLFIKSKWTTPDGSGVQQPQHSHLLLSSPSPRSLCFSPIPSTDLQPPPAPLQTSSRAGVVSIVFIIVPHSFTAGSQPHLRETPTNAVRGSAMTAELQESRVQLRGRNSSGLPWKLVV